MCSAILIVLVVGSIPLHAFQNDHLALEGEGWVFVDALHAEQEAHFEHSELVECSACPACIFVGKTKSLLPDGSSQPIKVTASGRPVGRRQIGPADQEMRFFFGRAPPLP